jgi:hypothetical protein
MKEINTPIEIDENLVEGHIYFIDKSRVRWRFDTLDKSKRYLQIKNDKGKWDTVLCIKFKTVISFDPQ